MKMKFVLFTLLVFSQSAVCISQTSQFKSVFDCIYDNTGTPTIQLETTWNKLINQKMDEAYIPAKITFPINGSLTTFDVKVRARGMMRKQVCYYPPIKVDFKKKDLLEHKLDTAINKLKLVFQCRAGEANDELLMREKLGYALYKVVAPKYHIEYKQCHIDAIEDGKTKFTLDAMALEDEKQLAKRTGGKVIINGKLMASALEKDTYQRMSVFQYMIGNTDWSIPNKHNVEMIKGEEYQRVVPIAYDFDYSALVGAPYAVPHESLPIQSINERYMMGRGITESDAIALGKWFTDKKPEFDKVINEFEGLSDKAKKNVQKFLEDFYNICKDEKKAKNNLARM